MPGKSRRFPPVLGGALGALLIALGLSGTALAQQPLKIGFGMSLTGPLAGNDKVDLVVSGYGTNVIAPAMPIMMQRNLTFMTLFGLNVNSKFKYDRYFQIMPAGPDPAIGWSQGFFE